MRKFIESLVQLPKWYGFVVVLTYSTLMAVYMSDINTQYLLHGMEISGILKIFLQLHFVLMILSSIVVWIVFCLLFHLTALLFNGKCRFGQFLKAAAYPYIIPAVFVFIAILMLDNVTITGVDDMVKALLKNERFQLIVKIVNYSFIPYYLIVSWIIHHLYRLKYPYAMLSVAVPIGAIWGVTELFKLI
jgi:hypothetical protein bfra3_00210